MNTSNSVEKDLSTEQKIKEAARTVFHQKGFSATRTRDIAEVAGINLALLNYYFRSKEKLFELIMTETMFEFLKSLTNDLNNLETSFEQKVTAIVERYIDMLLIQPEMPLFILSELKRNPEGFLQKMNPHEFIVKSIFMQQYQQEVANGRMNAPHFIHFLINVMSLTVFPFVASPMLKHVGSMGDEQFVQLMKQRKALIPQWISAMFLKP